MNVWSRVPSWPMGLRAVAVKQERQSHQPDHGQCNRCLYCIVPAQSPLLMLGLKSPLRLIPLLLVLVQTGHLPLTPPWPMLSKALLVWLLCIAVA